MSKIVNVQWQVSVTLNREQVRSLAIIASFMPNVISYLKENWSECNTMNEDAIKDAFRLFDNMKRADSDFYKQLTSAIVTAHDKE